MTETYIIYKKVPCGHCSGGIMTFHPVGKPDDQTIMKCPKCIDGFTYRQVEVEPVPADGIGTVFVLKANETGGEKE